MDIFKEFIEQIRVVVREEMKSVVNEMVRNYSEDRWMNKKQLAEYWGVSTKWIENHLDSIPHSDTLPWRFKKSVVDEWRMGESKREAEVNMKKASIKNYKSSSFRVGK